MNNNDRTNDRVYDILDTMKPDETQKDKMWDSIMKAADAAEKGASEPVREVKAAGTGSAESKKSRKADNKIFFRRIMAAAAALLLVVGGIGWFTSQPEKIPSLTGHVYAAESRATDMTPAEVLVQTGSPEANNQFYVYAPKIYYLDGSRLIFGNGTGLVIYDIAGERVEGLVDMQAICSGYYNTDSLRTHVLVSNDELIVYNTQSSGGDLTSQAGDDFENTDVTEKPWGYYHVFDMPGADSDGGLLSCKESGNDEEKIKAFMEQGHAFEAEHFMDAWDRVAYLQSKEMDDIIGNGVGTYSEEAYACRSETGELTKNVLVSRDTNAPAFELCCEADKEGAKPVFTKLDLGITDELMNEVADLNKLPAYKYNGNDLAVGVICDYLAGDYAGEYYEGLADGSEVSIPAPVIFAEKEKDGELLVFGNFWTDNYSKNGNTLISVSGGEMPACFHLVQSGSTYEIASFDVAEDGELYTESIKKMTEGFPGLYEQFLSGSKNYEEIRREAIRGYVSANGLGIDYYKDFGWDPLELN